MLFSPLSLMDNCCMSYICEVLGLGNGIKRLCKGDHSQLKLTQHCRAVTSHNIQLLKLYQDFMLGSKRLLPEVQLYINATLKYCRRIFRHRITSEQEILILNKKRNLSIVEPVCSSLSQSHLESISKQGLCVIICNYTSALVGFEYDVDLIESLFVSVGYVVKGGLDDVTWHDLTLEKLRRKLADLKNELNESEFDLKRLFVFVITASGRIAHDDLDDVTHASPDMDTGELVSAFASIKQLQRAPKMFFVHNCESAYDTRANTRTCWQHDNSFEPFHSNMLFYKSLSLNYRSIMVPGHGSWLIQCLLPALAALHKQHPVRDVLAIVNRHIWKLFSEEERPYKLPSWTSTLHSNFYLCDRPLD